jgi:STE24 endopeptidase
MEGSRRSGHSNAYFTGIGRAKRIVLFDTLTASMSDEEIVAVLAHEIGHEKKNHIKKMLAVSLALSLLAFWIMSLLLPHAPLYRAFGFSRPSYHAIITLLAFCSGPFTFFAAPLSSMWSRRHEYGADRFAVDATGNPGAMRSMLIKLTRENLSNLTPHPLYSFYHYSHPTISERLKALDKHAASGG